MKKLISFFLVIAVAFIASACNTGTDVQEHTEGESVGESATISVSEDMPTAAEEIIDMQNESGIAGLGTALFKKAYTEGDNTLVSPLSVYSALSMLTAGAGGRTLSQLESALGKEYGDLKTYMRDYYSSLDGTDALRPANSVWLRDDEALSIGEDFLAENREYFLADVMTEPFDEGTVKKINGWVREKTDDMIPSIVDDITPDTMAYLINALAFDNEWAAKYTAEDIHEAVFTAFDGTEENMDFLTGNENMKVSFDAGDIAAVGFKKDYTDGRFSFVAAMPEDKNVDFSAFVNGLDAEAISGAVASPERGLLSVSLPAFESGYADSLADELISMGVADAFDRNNADLARMGSYAAGNLYVDDVLHKTYISVTADGTRAAAVTAVTVKNASAMLDEPEKIVFDRPFIYMIWDNEANIPLFIGAAEKI